MGSPQEDQDKMQKLEDQTHNLVKMDVDSFTEAIKNDFGFVITEVEKNTKGTHNKVYKAVFEGKEIFIRINENPDIFPAELLGYKIFKQHGIPVPEVIAYQEKPPAIGYSTMIMFSAEGKSIRNVHLSPEQEDVVFERLGEISRTIHKVKLEGYGPSKASGEQLKGKFSTWGKYWESQSKCSQAVTKYIKHHQLLTAEESRKLDKVYKEIESLGFEHASLLHGDLHQKHVFVVKDHITGIIDLGNLSAGDPRYDIAFIHSALSNCE